MAMHRFASTHVPFTHEGWLGHVKHSAWLAALIVTLSLALGVIGYHVIGHLAWIDALLEASMILGGMGAVAPMTTPAVKLFASFYAMFSGFAVLTTTSIILAPWVHRLLYKTHRQARCDAELDRDAKK